MVSRLTVSSPMLLSISSSERRTSYTVIYSGFASIIAASAVLMSKPEHLLKETTFRFFTTTFEMTTS